jgi:hypothetical protein
MVNKIEVVVVIVVVVVVLVVVVEKMQCDSKKMVVISRRKWTTTPKQIEKIMNANIERQACPHKTPTACVKTDLNFAFFLLPRFFGERRKAREKRRV